MDEPYFQVADPICLDTWVRLVTLVLHLRILPIIIVSNKYYSDGKITLNICFFGTVDLVTLDDLSAAAMLESSARIESLANAWEHMSADHHPQLAPPAPMPSFRRHAGFFGQIMALTKRFILYKQPGSLLAWISKLISAAVLSLLIGCIFWDVPISDPQLELNDRLG